MNNVLKYKEYHARIEFSADERVFFGEVCGIDDSLNFYGFSVEEVETAFHQCIDNYLDMCKEFGKEPDKEYKGTFNVRISPELHKKIALLAFDEGISLNQFVEKALKEAAQETKSGPIYILSMSQVEAIPVQTDSRWRESSYQFSNSSFSIAQGGIPC